MIMDLIVNDDIDDGCGVSPRFLKAAFDTANSLQ